MKKLILSCLFLGLVACNPSVNTTDNQKPKVISTSTMIADLTAGVGGEEIDHQDILKPGDDPHVYEPVPSDSVALEKADLILYNGYNLEPGLIKMINSTAVKAKKVAVGEAITPLQLEKEGQKVPDPHVWGSAKNGIIMVKTIRDQLIELSPEDKEIFTENAAQLIRELENLDRWITVAIETIPPSQRQLVTTHDAFQYYAHAYGLKVAGTLIGISTEEQPSAQTVKNLADAIKNLQVPAIFAETTINPALITTVAAEAGVKLAPQQLYSDSIGAVGTGGDSYVKMLKENTRSIVESLGGKVPE
ncbi:zinc ABC transporter substrate-binding protein [Microcystis flos-aquae FACHB-1344]|uniref:Zinc ABC transporter substrate-binding protein n=1 Tax=Microcystis flos-aquae FACHB-1344 TaxID=2692899 RepID=A0ABR8HWY0_9CHRO|nr:zinc ABC transporter substrate-binding protein [Microcystis flos-aquae]MBD2623044.1 zinc ABC transporter substrate-binding protein [Microcystis flos-aquae FACHB-1344]